MNNDIGNVSVWFKPSFGILSFRDGWDHYLLICACLFSFFGCGRILWEEYRFNFHRKKRGGKKGQKPGEPHNRS